MQDVGLNLNNYYVENEIQVRNLKEISDSYEIL